MNVLKHMEAIFIAAALVAVPASYVGGSVDANARNLGGDAMIASGAKMATVTVSAKRLDAAEKTALLAAEDTATRGRM